MQVGWGRSPAQAPAAGRREASGGRSRGGGVGGRCVWQEQAQPGRQQVAGGQAGGCQVQRVGTQGNKFMPRKQGPTKADSWVNALHLNSPGRS